MTEDITPFSIAVPEAALEQLRNKLSQTTFPTESDFSDDRDYGVSLSDIKRLTEYWKEGFDWRAHEAKLNQFPQFTTAISVDDYEELNIHFIHQKSNKPNSIPLLFVHGWPGSFIEATKIIPLLIEPKDDNTPSFHVVAPSLPNFGFSDKVKKKAFGVKQYAEVMHKVMLKLGYNKYVTQGGDWGFTVTRAMGLYYPEHCLATHVNIISVRPTPWRLFWLTSQYYLGLLSKDEQNGIFRSLWYLKNNLGYVVLQSQTPNTIGFALADSPVALLAWIYEKLQDWTDEYPWTDDEILQWISVYLFSRAGPASSLTIYYDLAGNNDDMTKVMEYIPKVPLGLSLFPKDVFVPPASWGSYLGPVTFSAAHKRGGHFAAYECPEEIVGDLRQMFGKEGGAYQVARTFESV